MLHREESVLKRTLQLFQLIMYANYFQSDHYPTSDLQNKGTKLCRILQFRAIMGF